MNEDIEDQDSDTRFAMQKSTHPTSDPGRTPGLTPPDSSGSAVSQPFSTSSPSRAAPTTSSTSAATPVAATAEPSVRPEPAQQLFEPTASKEGAAKRTK